MKLVFNREPLDLSRRITNANIDRFVDFIISVNDTIGFKVSSRGWAYLLELEGFITKAQFDKVEALINKCRKEGLLPVDFVAEEDARSFKEIHIPTTDSVDEHIRGWANSALECESYYTPDWWDGEEYYIQMIVEKVDLVTLFRPICRQYHIPIANSKGWSSILQRAEYARRFADAESEGLKCVLLYCGDHDPDGLRISDTLRKNLWDLHSIVWSDGTEGYLPNKLIIERFGLNYDFIIENNLTWIDNLITGSKKNLADPNHINFTMPYVQEYLRDVGERKCEANALVTRPNQGQDLCRRVIEKYLGKDARKRFMIKERDKRATINFRISEIGLDAAIEQSLNKL